MRYWNCNVARNKIGYRLFEFVFGLWGIETLVGKTLPTFIGSVCIWPMRYWNHTIFLIAISSLLKFVFGLWGIETSHKISFPENQIFPRLYLAYEVLKRQIASLVGLPSRRVCIWPMRYWNPSLTIPKIKSLHSVCIWPMRYWNYRLGERLFFEVQFVFGLWGIETTSLSYFSFIAAMFVFGLWGIETKDNHLSLFRILRLYLAYEVLKLGVAVYGLYNNWKFVFGLWGIETEKPVRALQRAGFVCIWPMRYWNRWTVTALLLIERVCIWPMRYWN